MSGPEAARPGPGPGPGSVPPTDPRAAVPERDGVGGDGKTPGGAARLPGQGRWWRLGAVTAAFAGLLWGATSWDGGLRLDAGPSTDGAVASVPAPGALLVEDAALACPGPELLGVEADGGDHGGDSAGVGAGVRQSVEVAAAVAPDGLGDQASEGAVGGGGAVLRTTADEGATADLVADGPGTLGVDEAAAGLVDADGAAAPGLVGGQLGLTPGPGSRGLALTACTAPAETQWLVGGGGEPGRTEQLVLTNPGPDAVTVQVTVWGTDGPAVTTGGAAVVVPGRGRSVHLLDALAAQVGSPVVRVRSTGGAVVAHLGEHHREGTTELGAEVVGPAAAPATDLVVPALTDGELPTDGGTTVTLRLVAPGDEEAVVDLTALTADGAVRLASGVTRVPAGSTVDVVLGDLPEGAHALRVRSDTPVTAGALLTLDPVGDAPLAPDDASVTTAPEGAGDGPSGDAAASTADPPAGDDAAATGQPSPAADASGTTADPSATTDAPAAGPPPVLRPAGETAWVAATTPSRTPVGIALPARYGIPQPRTLLVVSVVDATTATVHLLDDRGRVTREELGRVGNDTTVVVDVPAGTRAVWATTDGDAGVVASVVVGGADRVGPYLTAATLPAVPWGRAATEVTVVRP